MPRWKNVLQTSDEVYRVKRNAVLREATRIIARRGFHNTSLDDVAEALQVSKGTLYNYVTDKLEIPKPCINKSTIPSAMLSSPSRPFGEYRL